MALFTFLSQSWSGISLELFFLCLRSGSGLEALRIEEMEKMLKEAQQEKARLVESRVSDQTHVQQSLSWGNRNTVGYTIDHVGLTCTKTGSCNYSLHLLIYCIKSNPAPTFELMPYPLSWYIEDKQRTELGTSPFPNFLSLGYCSI